MNRPVKTVTITVANGALHRRGLTLQCAAREMFVRRSFLKHMLETHGTCVVEHPVYMKAVWETTNVKAEAPRHRRQG